MDGRSAQYCRECTEQGGNMEVDGRRKLPEIMCPIRSIISSQKNAAASSLLGHSVIKAQ